jgi:hypothetical protein
MTSLYKAAILLKINAGLSAHRLVIMEELDEEGSDLADRRRW